MSEADGGDTAIVGSCSKQAKELHNTPSGMAVVHCLTQQKWASLASNESNVTSETMQTGRPSWRGYAATLPRVVVPVPALS